MQRFTTRANLGRTGKYILGANAFSSFGAPDTERRFATAYHPTGESEERVPPLFVASSTALRLVPLKLRRLQLTTIKIRVLWADGSRSKRSNLYFKNTLYPLHGGVAPQIDDGEGAYSFPKDSSTWRQHRSNVTQDLSPNSANRNPNNESELRMA
jgi:hypothetical protein